MVAKPRQSKGEDGAPTKLSAAIETMNSAEERSTITPAKILFGSVRFLLTRVRVRFLLFCNGMHQGHSGQGSAADADELDYVEFSLSCAGVCRILDQGLSGRRADELSRSVLEAIEQLTA